MATLCITNVEILNNTKPSKADIFISGDRISAVGNFYNKKADEVIDADGAYISPGFFDINNAFDQQKDFFKNQGKNLLIQGITSALIGQNGRSLAPLFYLPPYLAGFHVNWHTIGEFLKVLDNKTTWVNFGTFVGWDVLFYIFADKKRVLTNKEFNILRKVLNDALSQGAFGLSLRWEDVLLGLITTKQLNEILKILQHHSAIFSVFLPRQPNIKNVVENILKIVSQNEVKTLINNYLTEYLTPSQNIEVLKMISNFYPSVFLSFSPYDFEPVFINELLPEWLKNKNEEEISKNFNDPWMQKRIINSLTDVNPANFFIIDAGFKEGEGWSGKNLKDLMDIYETSDFKYALFNLMKNSKFKSIVAYQNINHDVLIDLLLSKSSLISTGFLLGNKNTFLDFLNMILEHKLMSLEEALQKISLLPAQFCDIKNIEIKTNNKADLVAFFVKDKKIKIKFIIINGKVCFKDNYFYKSAANSLKHKEI